MSFSKTHSQKPSVEANPKKKKWAYNNVLLNLNGDIELNDNFSQSCFDGMMRIEDKLERIGALGILHHCGFTSVTFYILIPLITNDFKIIICFPKRYKE